MTAADMPRWAAAIRRFTLSYAKTFSPEQVTVWFEKLERFPVEVVERALWDAPSHEDAGQYLPSLGLVEKIAKKHMAGTPRSTGDWHAPEVMRDEHGKVTVAYRCGLCCDTGWRGVVTETGVLLTEAELQAWELYQKPTGARVDGRPHVTRRRCACRTQTMARTA